MKLYHPNILFISLLHLFINLSTCDITPEEVSITTQKWIRASKSLDRLFWPQTDLFLQLIDSLTSGSFNISSECKRSLKIVSHGLETRKHWALKFVDATGKGRSGLAYGYVSDIGNMDECLTIDQTVKSQRIAGKYCLMNIHLPLLEKTNVEYARKIQFNLNGTELEQTVYELYGRHMEMMMYTPMTFKFGLCFPSSCRRAEIEHFVNSNLKGTELRASITPYCETKDRPVNTHHAVAIIFAVTYVIFVILASIVTFSSEKQEKFLEHFNIFRNSEKLVVESSDPVSQQISFFHGIRFYYQLVAISAHVVDIQPFLSALYPVMYERSHHNVLLQQGYKMTGFFVQIPFAVSGFLAYVTMYPYFVMKKGKVGFGDFAFKRWFRTTPTLIGVMILSFAWAGVGRGPIFREGMELTVEKCKTYWWANILYINNWFHFDQLCLFHTWTYSADFQLYCLSFICLKIAYKNKKFALYSILGMMLTGILMSSFVTWYKDMPPFPNFDATDSREYDLAAWMYFHTYHSMPSYFLGVLVAYCFLEKKEMPQKYIPWGWAVAWTLALPTALFPIFYPMNGEPETRWIEIIFGGLHRICFVQIWVWSGYLCCFNLSWWIRAIYDIKLWVPFGRMSSSVFLAHFTFIWVDVPNSQDYSSTRVWNLVMKFTYTLVMSWIYSYIVYLMFEAPSMSFAKVILKKQSRQFMTTTTPKPQGDERELSLDEKNKSLTDHNDNLRSIDSKKGA